MAEANQRLTGAKRKPPEGGRPRRTEGHRLRKQNRAPRDPDQMAMPGVPQGERYAHPPLLPYRLVRHRSAEIEVGDRVPLVGGLIGVGVEHEGEVVLRCEVPDIVRAIRTLEPGDAAMACRVFDLRPWEILTHDGAEADGVGDGAD